VASAETTYVDPSALLKLYVHQPQSAAMSTWRARTRGALAVTHHGHGELVNAICLAEFRGDISGDARRDALASLEEDFAEGRYRHADLLWRAALTRARDLSMQYTARLGCRSLDLLHVASALELGMQHFVTFDERQGRLVRAMGLRLLTPAARR
jgi:predicted nucleic acid-binding protein